MKRLSKQALVIITVVIATASLLFFAVLSVHAQNDNSIQTLPLQNQQQQQAAVSAGNSQLQQQNSASATVTPATQTPTKSTTPDPYSCNITSLGTCMLNWTAVAINQIVGLGVAVSAFLVQIALQFNAHVFDSPAVTTGFSVALAIANLGFVLGIIIIAIATILRSTSYGIKQLLWKLVFMAVLVNFGLVITSPIVGFADNLTQYFMNGIAGGSNSIGNAYQTYVTSIINASQAQLNINPVPPQNVTDCINRETAANSPDNTAQAGAYSGAPGGAGIAAALSLSQIDITQLCYKENNYSPPDTFWTGFLALIFGAVLSSIITITLLALAILLLVRYATLGILLILLPLAWLTWIFPQFSSNFSKWWNEFIKWTFFPPLALFFIYLAFTTFTSSSYHQAAMMLPPGSANGIAGSIGITTNNNNYIQQIIDYALLITLMIGGLFAAHSLTGEMGKKTVNIAKSAAGGIGGYIGGKTKNGAGFVTSRVKTAGKQYNPATKETTTALQRFGSSLQGIPGLRGVGARIAQNTAPESIKKANEKKIQDYVDSELKPLTNDGIISRATSRTAFLDETKAAALAQEIARRNLSRQLDTDPIKSEALMRRFVEKADRSGNIEKIIGNRPDLMPARPGETPQQTIARAVKMAKGEVIQANADVFNLAHPIAGMSPDQVKSAVLTLTPAQLGALGNDTTSGSVERQNNLTDTIRNLAMPFRRLNATTNLNELDDTSPAFITVAAINPGLKNLKKLVIHMKNNPSWSVDVLN